MNIMTARHTYLRFSLGLVMIGLAALGWFKLRPAIDFTGGSVLELQFPANIPIEQLSTSHLQALTKETYNLETVQSVANNQVILRGTPLTNEQKIRSLLHWAANWAR
jgi:preprotein translocase subunit SecF